MEDYTQTQDLANMILFLCNNVANISNIQVITEEQWNFIAKDSPQEDLVYGSSHCFIQRKAGPHENYYCLCQYAGLNGETWLYVRTREQHHTIDYVRLRKLMDTFGDPKELRADEIFLKEHHESNPQLPSDTYNGE